MQSSEWLVADLDSGKITVLAGGHDFVAAPRLSPDGSQLAWVAWDHPNMPWDDTTLYVAQVGSDGSLSKTRKVCSLLTARRMESQSSRSSFHTWLNWLAAPVTLYMQGLVCLQLYSWLSCSCS